MYVHRTCPPLGLLSVLCAFCPKFWAHRARAEAKCAVRAHPRTCFTQTATAAAAAAARNLAEFVANRRRPRHTPPNTMRGKYKLRARVRVAVHGSKQSQVQCDIHRKRGGGETAHTRMTTSRCWYARLCIHMHYKSAGVVQVKFSNGGGAVAARTHTTTREGVDEMHALRDGRSVRMRTPQVHT